MTNESHDWEDLFDHLPLDTSVTPSQQEELRAKVLQTFADNAAEPSPTRRLKEIGHVLVKHKAPHWTVAALVIVGLAWIASSGGTSALALDEVIDNLAKARTARFDMTVKVVGQPELKAKAFYLEPSHFRQELVNGYVNISDWSVGKMIGLVPQSKQATVINLVNLPGQGEGKSQPNQFEATRELLRKAVDDPDVEVESLGEKRLDGRTVAGFRFDTPTNPTTVWVDPETKFPVQIEATMIGPPETKVVMSNYEFNVELDESLFSTEVPEGYEILETSIDASPSTEKDFITALRIGSDGSDGSFPPGFDAAAIASYVAGNLAREGIKDGKPSEEQMQQIVKISRGLQFALTLPAESDAHYAGAKTKRDEPDRPIFWYKRQGAAAYRVIYADLTVKEATTAPVVEGATKLWR